MYAPIQLTNIFMSQYKQQFLEFSDKNSRTVLSLNKYTPNLGKWHPGIWSLDPKLHLYIIHKNESCRAKKKSSRPDPDPYSARGELNKWLDLPAKARLIWDFNVEWLQRKVSWSIWRRFRNIWKHRYTYAYGRQRAGRGKSSPCCPLFPLGAVVRVPYCQKYFNNSCLAATWENFPTYVLPAVLLLVQPVESSVQYKTVELHQKRRVPV